MTKISRVRDWRARLSGAIETKRREKFSWSKNNCGFFLADCVYAMTSTDLAAPFRGLSFNTPEEAMQVLKSAGYDDLCDFLAGHLEEIHPAFARQGDIAVFPSEITGWAGGIVNGERITVLRPDGLGTVPLGDATRVFQVP